MKCLVILYTLLILNWFSNETLESVDTSNIKDWHPSKRLGFWEINGIIKFQFSGGSFMELTWTIVLNRFFKFRV